MESHTTRGKKLLLEEIKMVSLLMCIVLPYNYSEQGIWINEKSKGQYYNYFKDKNVDSGHRKLLDSLKLHMIDFGRYILILLV